MKTLISYFLAASLALTGIRFLETRSHAQIFPGGIVLLAVGIGACIIIKAMHRPDPLIDRVLVLQVNYRTGNGWENVVTNFHAVLYSDRPCSIFGVQMHMLLEDNESAKFRVQDITDWWRAEHPYTIDWTPEGPQSNNFAWSIP